jgi:nicotinamidase-related amidase
MLRSIVDAAIEARRRRPQGYDGIKKGQRGAPALLAKRARLWNPRRLSPREAGMKDHQAALGAALVALIMAAPSTARADNVLAEWAGVKPPAPPEVKPVTVDPKRTALLLFDFTNQTCTPERRPRCAANVPRLQKLLAAARRQGMFVVYSVPGAGATARDILGALAPAGDEPVLPPLGPDKFIGSDFESMLRGRGVDTVILTGTAAHTTVLHTGGGAALRGFKVVVPVDGMASNEAFSELYTTWHLANAARIMNQVTLTTVDMIGY